MPYTGKQVTLYELKDLTSEELAQAVHNYFKIYPKKTVFNIDNKFTIRKHLTKVNVYEIHGR